ncbi:Ig-like domain-containing protein [Paenibacillus endoradicis]|uniref:Ig-like domain-containing protein n=1 Tax=Paenibacillus endoradicis TaxID=2972487 RepID=UPI002158FC58|nr:Ig-like domain-containing protein [Paenibacillus endoradicis]MCR8660492.1 Ig-like domain-containing protein [Paenibacillus endoradicis]
MQARKKLSMLVAIMLLLQLFLPIWSDMYTVKAAVTGPQIVSLSPANGTSNVPTSGKFIVTFDENIKFNDQTKKIGIYTTSTNTLYQEYAMSNSRVTISKNVLTLDARNLSLPLNTDYYILMEAGAVANESNGALFNGITNPATWSFRTIETVDNSRPTILSVTSGLCGATGTCSTTVPITTTLQFVFDKAVYVSEGNIELTSTTDNRSIPVSSSEVQGSGSNVITITPSQVLKPSTTYKLTISGSNIVDASGNGYVGGSWRVVTAASPIQLISTTPTAGASSVVIGSNIELTFDQSVEGSLNKYIRIRKVSNNEIVYERATKHSSVTYSNNNKTVTIKPGSALEKNTSYYVTIDSGAFAQVGNPSAIFYGIHSATDWMFSTDFGTDNIKPTIKTYSPTIGNTNVGVKEKIVLTFSEIVIPNSGTIEIREYNSDALYRSIPVTSDRVSGGGSTVITIDPHAQKTGESAKSFSVATRYYVKITNNAFSDVAGNTYVGTTQKTYNFQVAASASAPQIATISPANLSTTVATTAKFKATFDKSILIDERNYNVTIYSLAVNGTAINATLEVDPTNAKGVIITPNSTLLANTDYYINISDMSIMDVNGNYYAGIQNQYQWKIKTLGGDITPPTIVKAEVSGNTIRVVYNELLNEELKPSIASFYATANDKAKNISSVTIEGNVVFIKLVSSVSTSEKVALSYTKPNSGLIQDLSGNQAASFSGVNVTSGFTENKPTVKSSSYSGSTVTLNFTETLNSINRLAYTQFTVSVNGTLKTISSMTQSGSNLTITLNQSIPAKANIVVSYVSGFYPITGTTDASVANFSHVVGTTSNSGSGGTNTSGAPTIQYITLSGNQLFLKYDEAIKTTSKPGAYQYAVLVNGKVSTVTAVTINNDTIVLTLASKPTDSLPITVSYYGTSSTLLDNDYNAAASFTSMAVTDGSDIEEGSTVTVQGAVLKGNVLTLNFSGNLDTTSVPATDQFQVRVSNNTRVISSVNISGSQVILKLSTTVNVGEVATVTYFSQSSMLQSKNGIAVSGFSNMAVANQTTVLDALSDDYASAPNGVLLKTSASSTSNVTSPGGSSVTNYTITTDKFVTAITTLAAAEMKTGNIVFEVPTSQNAAIVSYSIAALQAAAKIGNYTLVVNYGDLTYSVPLSAIDLSKAASQSGGNSVSNYLRIAFEEGSTSATSSLETAINRSGATIVQGPFAYELTVVNGSTSEKAVITGNISRTAKSSDSITYSNTTAVYYDEGISAISAAPTTFTNSNGLTTITFKRPGNSAYAIVKSNKTFSDTSSHWAHNEITIMARKFIVEGHSTTNFNPKSNITRGEFATYIVKGLGLSANKAAAKQFKDVNSDTVMGGYIGAAVAAGIVSGVSNTSFEPNSYITRQDMALMMVRAASYAGLSTKLSSSADSILNGYSDKSQLSSYAKTGVATAINLGIISGTTTTKLSPKQNATRAEGTLMIMRLLKKTDLLQY